MPKITMVAPAVARVVVVGGGDVAGVVGEREVQRGDPAPPSSPPSCWTADSVPAAPWITSNSGPNTGPNTGPRVMAGR